MQGEASALQLAHFSFSHGMFCFVFIPRRAVESLSDPAPSSDGIPVTEKPFLLEGWDGKGPAEGWLKRSLPLAGSTGSRD